MGLGQSRDLRFRAVVQGLKSSSDCRVVKLIDRYWSSDPPMTLQHGQSGKSPDHSTMLWTSVPEAASVVRLLLLSVGPSACLRQLKLANI